MSLPRELTLRALLENSIHHHAERPAVSFVDQQPMTYQEVKSGVDRIQSLLAARGIDKGDRVALLSQNMPNWVVAYLAITGMGAVVVPILVDFTSEEIVNILRHSEASCVVVSEKQAEKLKQPLPDSLQSAILIDTLSEISLGSLEYSGRPEPIKRDELVSVESVESLLSRPKEEDLAAILYTSGTTEIGRAHV